MGKKSRGFLRQSRDYLRKSPRERGPAPPSRFLREYKSGQKVVIDVFPSFKGGLPHRRYQGKVGTVSGKRGRCYIVDLSVGKKKRKRLIISPVHLKPHQQS